MIGTTISHYRVLERLGAGGMGEVWKAEDTRLHRQVALKLLLTDQRHKSDAHSAELQQRFLREARTAAALNHPNIATIYEIDRFERDGASHSFIAMEYVPGQTLRDYAQSRRLSVDEAIDIIRQIAGALDAAHQRGIAHRDIKPTNIIVSSAGQVKVLDFGLAKLTEVRNSEFGMRNEEGAETRWASASNTPHSALRTPHFTTPGLVMGTPAYMSPEQARGEEVDQRSDIFSLGVVFYELLTGRLPFTGHSPADVISSLLQAEPPALQVSNSQVTPELERLVRSLLEKHRDRRCQTMREVLRELETNQSTRRLYEFGPFALDVAERRLAREGQPVALKPKVFDLLTVLIENRGRLLEKEQLYQALWPDSVVEEVNLNVNVSALRKALGETPASPQYIETIPKKGYRFIAAVTEKAIAAPPVRTLVRADPAATQLMPAGEPEPLPVANIVQPLTIADASHPPRSPARLTRLALPLAVVLLSVVFAGAVYVLRSRPEKTAAPGIRTIAVLPFRSLPGGEADQALSLGMADALITRLGSLHPLTVRPTSAVMKYAAADTDSLAAGHELKVDAVLEGRVQRDDKKIRISAQMLRVPDGTVLWAGKFDDFFTNIFAVQDSISEKMAEMLAVRLTSNEQQAMNRRYTENTEAYQLYLLGSYYHHKLGQQNLQKALSYYQTAIEKDPHYPLPWAAMVGLFIGWSNAGPDQQRYRAQARAAADRAISLAPELAEAHAALGTVQMAFDWDFRGAEQSLKRAIELNPNSSDVRDDYAVLLSVLGRSDEALREVETARQIDPTSAYLTNHTAMLLLRMGRVDEAIEQAQKALELDSQFIAARSLLAEAYSRKGQHEKALETIRKFRELGGINVSLSTGLIYARAGRRVDAEEILAELSQRAERDEISLIAPAALAAALGDREAAIEWLEKAYQQKSTGLLLLKRHEQFDPLRADPRFQDLLRRIGLPQ